MITLSQKTIESRGPKPVVDNDTLVTIPIKVYASMLSALPNVKFEEVKIGILEHLSSKNNHEEFIECLKSHAEQAEFYIQSREIVKEFETFLEMRKVGKINLHKSTDEIYKDI